MISQQTKCKIPVRAVDECYICGRKFSSEEFKKGEVTILEDRYVHIKHPGVDGVSVEVEDINTNQVK